jgi:spermidine synthase
VLDAARTEFAAANHAVLSRSNVRTIREDAALYLRGTRARYDLIVSQPSNPWVLGMADLFTAEAFAAARERLNSGGAMAVWFHAYSIDEATFAGIVSTFRAVFPASTLIEINSGQDYLLVGFVEPVSVDVDRLVARLADRAVTSRLVSAGIADRAAFFGRFVAGPRGVRAIADGAEVFHADDLRLEFRAPALLYTDASERIVALLDRHRNLPLEGLAPRGDAYRIVLRETQPLAGAMRGSGTAMVRPVAVRPSRTAIARENRECH